MDVQKLAADLLPLVGGKENIRSVLHCMTRLRLQLADQSKAQLEAIEQLDGVMGVKVVGAQTQVIIGPNVAEVYKAVTKLTGDLGGDAAPAPAGGEEKQKLSAKLLDTVSGIFAPVVPLITGAGMIKAILTILVVFGLPNDSQEYTIPQLYRRLGLLLLPGGAGLLLRQKVWLQPLPGRHDRRCADPPHLDGSGGRRGAGALLRPAGQAQQLRLLGAAHHPDGALHVLCGALC